jgi:hypothetical protein
MSFKVEAMRLTKDPYSTKIAYVKGDKTFVRTGKDNFKEGIAGPRLDTLKAVWGFRTVETPPIMDRGEEVMKALSLGYFAINSRGNVDFR